MCDQGAAPADAAMEPEADHHELATNAHRKVDRAATEAARAQPPAALALCGHPPGATPRRGLCHRCYRKLREADCPLPPRLVPGPAALDPLERWVRGLPEDVRQRMAALLMERP